MAYLCAWTLDVQPDSQVREFARFVLDNRLKAVKKRLHKAAWRAGEDPEHVRQLRIMSRRSTVALDLFAEIIPKRRRKKLEQLLKTLRRSAGEARDLDVMIERLAGSDDPPQRALCKWIRRRRRQAQRNIIACVEPIVRKKKLRREIKRTLRIVLKTKRPPARESYVNWCREQLPLHWHALTQRVPQGDTSPVALHDFRVTVKRFRYALELLRPGLPVACAEVLYPEMGQLQTLLGLANDHHVAALQLQQWGKRANSTRRRVCLQQLASQEREAHDAAIVNYTTWWSNERWKNWDRIVNDGPTQHGALGVLGGSHYLQPKTRPP